MSGFAPAGLQAVQARVGQIEARLGTLTRTTAPTGAAGAAFARALDGARSVAASDGTPGAPGAGGAGGAVTGDDVVESVRKYLGVPYRWGGTDPATGLDCSGLVQRALADLGIEVPRVVADQQHAGTEVASLAQARPGDLLVWRGSPNHIGVYLGDGKMIHAPRTGDVVKISDVRREPPSTIRRVVPADGPGASVPAPAATADVPFGGVFRTAEQRYGLPSGVLAAVARAESGFDPDAVSGAGAVGLMQLMPGTAAELGVDPRDPVAAVDGAARYLRSQLDSFGDLRVALAAYNAGPGAVRRHGGVPPFDETRTYVARVLAAMAGGGR
ncbi:MAG: transglycosylase SLT domain-containing protein [Kineosporiaceae bacterium]